MTITDLRATLPKHPTATWSQRTKPPNCIVIHHSVTPGEYPISGIANYHITRDYPGIAYHYVVSASGVVYQCNDDMAFTWHGNAGGNTGIGVCLLGDFSAYAPPEEQVAAAADLVGVLKERWGITRVIGHREATGAQTACPGNTWPEWRDKLEETATVTERPKTTLHCQQVPGWVGPAVRQLGSGWVKLVNPKPEGDPFPDLAKDVRIWTDDWDRACIAKGVAGADEYMTRMLPTWQPYRDWSRVAFELPNEPPCNGNDELAALNAFTERCIYIANYSGITLIILNLPEGNPHDNGTGDPGVTRWKVQQLAGCVRKAAEGKHCVGLHGYWRPGVEGPTGRYHALRCVDMVGWWAEAGVPKSILHVALTEWGVDGGIAGNPPIHGWRDLLSQSDYVAQVAEGERALRGLPWLEFAALFTAGPESPWGTYEQDEGTVGKIVAACASVVSVPVEPPAEEEPVATEYPAVKAYTWDGKATTVEALQAVYGFTIKRATVAVGAEVFRLTAIREKYGDASQIARVLGTDGSPSAGRYVAWYWPDAPAQTVPNQWESRYEPAGPTNANGEVGPGMGMGAYHAVGQPGPHAMWLVSPSTASDAVFGLGMITQTDHHHVDVEFTLVTQEAAPSVPETPAPTTPATPTQPDQAAIIALRWNAEQSVREIEAQIAALQATRQRLLDNVVAQMYVVEGVKPA